MGFNVLCQSKEEGMAARFFKDRYTEDVSKE